MTCIIYSDILLYNLILHKFSLPDMLMLSGSMQIWIILPSF